jgi:hypothetical protein
LAETTRGRPLLHAGGVQHRAISNFPRTITQIKFCTGATPPHLLVPVVFCPVVPPLCLSGSFSGVGQ